MKNEVKKVIISLNDNKLEAVIIVKDNFIKTYSLKDYNQEELLNIYSSNVRELRKLYKEEIKGLSNQDAVNKLLTLGVIENNNNIITGIKIINPDSYNEKIIVDYIDSQEEIKCEDYFNREEYKARNDLFLIKNPHEQYQENIEDDDENDKDDIDNNESNNNETIETAYNKYSDDLFIF